MVKTAEHDCREFARVRRATRRSPYHFTESGLPNVYLVGIRVFACRKCRDVAAEIPAIEPLLESIARAVVEGEGRLTGAEIRFLRKRLGKKSSEFAQIVGVSPEQVSRWENGSNPPEAAADKLIRLFYVRLSGDRVLQRAFEKKADAEFERWLAGLPGGQHLGTIRAARSRSREWKVEALAA